MKPITAGKTFKTAYERHITPFPHLDNLFRKKLKQFITNRNSADLYDHALTGTMEGLRAFSLDYDHRVVYEETKESIILIDIGVHDDVYRL